MGMEITGIPWNTRDSCSDINKCCETPVGMENILWDSCSSVAVLDFYAASAPTSESSIHLFHMQNFWCLLNCNVNANWNVIFG